MQQRSPEIILIQMCIVWRGWPWCNRVYR